MASGPADLQRTGPAWPSQLQPWLLRPDLSPDLRWLCVVPLKAFSSQIVPNTQNVKRPPRGIFLSLDFSFLHKIDISPTFCFWLFKNQFGSSAFDSLSILNSPFVYSPTSFYIWQRDSKIFIFSSTLGLLLLWWPVDMCLLKPETLAHEVWSSFLFLFFSPWCIQFQTVWKKKNWLNSKEGRRSQSRETFLPCRGDGKMASISL